LVPFGETALFPEYSAFLNLGGIANLTLTAARGTAHRRSVAAFDVCACNQVLNALARRMGMEYDKDGSAAESGRMIPEIFEALENLAFYRLPAPRSLAREWVESEVMPLLDERHSPPDLMHTYCVHVARRIEQERRRYGHSGTAVMTTGGGAFHRFLVGKISESTPLFLPDENWIRFKEAAIFAFLGLMRLLGKPNILNAGTGARKAAVAGCVHFPDG
jgi:anhydro-N-acetylmuramic acid kinase